MDSPSAEGLIPVPRRASGLAVVVGPVAAALALALALALTACGSGPVVIPTDPPRMLPHEPVAAAVSSVERARAAGAAAVDPSQYACEVVEPGLVACPTPAHLENWGWSTHLIEPEEELLAAPLDPPDPVVIRDGLEIYDVLLHGVARRSRSQLDLWEHTPTYSAAEIAYFTEHPAVWRDVAAMRGTPAGRERREALRTLLQRYRNDPDALRHVVLRNGVFYFEDPETARLAERELKVADLFPDDLMEVDVERAGQARTLRRDRPGGHFLYVDPDLEGYRGRLTLFDRVGVPGELAPQPSYHLNDLRRRFGLTRIAVGSESGSGRAGEIELFTGEVLPALLVREAPGQPLLGVVAWPDDLREMIEAARADARVVYGLTDTAFEMVRENLFFDEPANEVGQQDGIMRRAFDAAFRAGADEYTVNGVTYPIYDELGRARPPQVCIDFITDVVERYAGSWWPTEREGGRRRTPGPIDLSAYMTYRQVRRLVELGTEYPDLVSLHAFTAGELIPYRDREAFFENLWKNRDVWRIGDIVVIYGLRSDGRNHYHSFYVYETDPIYGMPINLVDQAGHARIRTWDNIMSTAPARSVRHRVRWNPEWIRREMGEE